MPVGGRGRGQRGRRHAPGRRHASDGGILIKGKAGRRRTVHVAVEVMWVVLMGVAHVAYMMHARWGVMSHVWMGVWRGRGIARILCGKVRTRGRRWNRARSRSRSAHRGRCGRARLTSAMSVVLMGVRRRPREHGGEGRVIVRHHFHDS